MLSEPVDRTAMINWFLFHDDMRDTMLRRDCGDRRDYGRGGGVVVGKDGGEGLAAEECVGGWRGWVERRGGRCLRLERRGRERDG